MCSVRVICIYLCSIQCIHDFGEDWVIIIFIFLADELDVSQLCKVEVSLLLQPLYSQLQIQQLWAETVKRQITQQLKKEYSTNKYALSKHNLDQLN